VWSSEAGTRETAVIYAMTSSAVVHAITRSCSRGELRNCACDAAKDGQGHGQDQQSYRYYRGRSRDGGGDVEKKEWQWEWRGCSNQVRYAARFAKMFVDARENVRDARALMNRHNSGAGRKVLYFIPR